MLTHRAALWIFALALAVIPLRLSGQNASTKIASVRGVVVDENNKPVPRATVSIDNPAQAVQSDAAGKFLLADVVPGQHMLSVRIVGFQAVNQPVQLKAGDVLDVEVELTRISTLETNKIVGTSAARAEFDDRRTHKLGYVVDSSVLNNRADVFSALSTVPLTRVTRRSNGGVDVTVRSLGSRARCTPATFLDGLPATLDQVSALPPDHFRAIEVLPYEAVPAKYYTRICVGAILFWSKNVKW